MKGSEDIPAGWTTVALSSIAEVRLGRQRSPARATGPHMRPYMRAANVTWKGIDTSDVKEMDFTPSEYAIYALREGDILLSEASGSPSEVGKPAVWRGEVPECCIQNTLIRVRLGDLSLVRFLHLHFLKDATTGRFAAASRGVGIHHLGAEALVHWSVTLPPLPEQHRIVAAIEDYFSRLDEAVALLERVQRNLKRYRASVLKAAVEGRLVPTEAELARAEGRTYEPASVLLERILEERRRRWEQSGRKGKYQEPAAPDTTDLPDLPEGWCWASLDQFLVAIEAGKNFRCEERLPNHGEVGVVKVSAVTWGTFNEDETKTCTRPDFVDPANFIEEGDFLFSRANTIELVGACVRVHAVRGQVMLSDKILRLRFAGGMDSWILWVLRSNWGRRAIESLASGNQESMRNISQANLARIPIPLPPFPECNRIVGAIERAMTMLGSNERDVVANLARCSRLRQSILKWAFEGRLADQDPTDEPASVLLERIRAERAASGASKSTGRRRKATAPPSVTINAAADGGTNP